MSVQIKKHYASFSETIREGAKLRPQGFGVVEMRTDRSTSCAIEAGIEAIGADFDWADDDAIFELYPYMATKVISPLDGKPADLITLCWELNDEEWTREAIADWLESEEEELGFITLIEEAKQSAQELVTV